MLKPLATFARLSLRDTRADRLRAGTAEAHLLAAEAWLCRAQDVAAGGGVSYGYTLRRGWAPPYPETSGYIAPTFFRLGRLRDRAYAERAERIVQWLLTVQNRDGSFPNLRYGPDGIVFDTGQVLFGLICGFEHTGDESLLRAARRAAGWLTDVAGPDGRWTRHEHLGTPHVYNTRTAWALLRLQALEPDTAREAVARANLEWALTAQNNSGLFAHCSFREGEPPFTHTIAYTARGLLESGLLLNEPRFLEAAQRCADAVLAQLDADGFLPSRIGVDGRPVATSCCLTGNCQFAVVWARLHQVAPRPEYVAAMVRALDYVMSVQDIETSDADVRGGIKGSHPVWGRYASMSYPNWAAKFFIDAMWLRRDLVP
ncbi:MAG: prenyltransferase/squalene oxidase repeat-containing protein [Caldimonas sp.]